MSRLKRNATYTFSFPGGPLVLTPKTVPQFVIPPSLKQPRRLSLGFGDIREKSEKEEVISNCVSDVPTNEIEDGESTFSVFDFGFTRSFRRLRGAKAETKQPASTPASPVATSPTTIETAESPDTQESSQSASSSVQNPIVLPNIKISRHQSKKIRKPINVPITQFVTDEENEVIPSKNDSGNSSSSEKKELHRVRSIGNSTLFEFKRDTMRRKSSRLRRRQSLDAPCTCGRQQGDTSDSDELRDKSETLALRKDLIKMSLNSSLNRFLPLPAEAKRRSKRLGSTGTCDSNISLSPQGRSPTNLSPRNSLSPSPCSSICSSRKSSFGDLGDIKVSLLYDRSSSTLYVRVIKARGLGSTMKHPEKGINPYVKLCIVPGKQQKQQTSVAESSKDPTFKQTFIFKGIRTDSLYQCKVRLRVYNKTVNKRKDEFLGETKISIEHLFHQKERKTWHDLLPKSELDNLGSMELSVCLEKNAGTLTISVVKAVDLPTNLLTGAPDPYVKILVFQEKTVILSKKTRTKKKTTNPIYKEVFTFQISNNPDCIQSTSVEFTIYNKSKILSDDVIGQVKLGIDATEPSEIEQWEAVIAKNGQAFIFWHDIMEPVDM